ncbi:MAG TPA: LysM peptidoglycan-binding domain-containing protein [Longimicrobiales bacterium]
MRKRSRGILRGFVAPIGAAAALLAAATTATAQQRLVAVERRGPVVVEARPGELINVAFRLTNLTGRALRVWSHAELPPDWIWVSGRGGGRLAPGGGMVHVVAMQIPDTAAAGRYKILYDVVAGWPTGPQSRDTVVVAVAAVREIKVSLLDAPRYVRAGAPYEVRYLVENRGNVRTRVALEAMGARPGAARLDSATITLEPGEIREVPVRVEAGAAARLPARQAVTLRARAADAAPPVAAKAAGAPAGVARVVAATGVVEVLAANGRSGPEPFRFPLRLGIRGGLPRGSVPPLELSGRGPLDHDGNLRLDVLLRGPGTDRASPFGERDEYRIELTGRRFALSLGDRRYDAQLRTLPGRYGFGAGGRLSVGGLELGGFAVRDRRYDAGPGQQAAYVGYRIGGSGVRLHFGEETGGVTPGRAFAAQGVLAPLRGVSLAAEYGIADVDGGSARPDARALELRAARPQFVLGARHMRVDAGYPGQFSGAAEDFASLSVTPWKELRLGAWLNRSDRTFWPGTEQRVHTDAVDLGWGRYATLMLRSIHRFGAFSARPYDGRERSARLHLGVDVSWLRLRPEVELGVTEDLLTGEESDLVRYALRASTSLTGGTYAAWVDRFRGRSVYLATDRAWVSVGAQAMIRLGESSRLRLAFSSRRDDATGRWSPTVFDIGIEQGLPFGHGIVSRARSIDWGGSPVGRRTDALVEYFVPLAIPLPNGRAGRVTGRVYDAETGAGLAGVPVRLGDRAVLTDAQGRIEFRGVEPGTHILTLDRPTRDIGRVALVDLPMTLEVSAGAATDVEIGLVRGARLTGAVRRFAFEEVLRQDEVPELVEAGGVGNVLVELSRDGEVHRRLTDARGRFDFGLLRPGRWTLKIHAPQLPANHEIEAPQTIELEAGGAREVAVRVVPRRRPVRIIDRAEVTAEPPAADAGAVQRAPAAGRAVERRHTVERDDAGLMDVARAVYGDASLWPKIWLANREALPNPDLIRTGQTLVIPPPGPLTAAERRARDAYYRERGFARNVYMVREGDRTLMQIARNVYNDASLWVKLWVANRAEIPDPDRIRPGQVLYVPPKAPLTADEREALREYQQRRGGQ